MDLNVETVIELMKVPGEPGKERVIFEKLQEMLREMGVPAERMTSDRTQEQSEYGGEVGNLIVRLEGRGSGQRRMFSTHMDTVPGAIGCQPRLEGERIVNSAAGKALGGDARAGCAILMAVARALTERKGDHPPRVLVFFAQEEVGLVGSRGLDLSLLGEPLPAMCFNFDGGAPEVVINGGIGTQRLNIEITGSAAHSSNPSKGISAAVILAEALAELEREGWNNRIDRPEGSGCANLGILRGGTGSNVVMPGLYALAESRSFDRDFREKIVEVWRETFARAVERANTKAAERGLEVRAAAELSPGPVYDPYVLAEDSPVVRASTAAVEKAGLTPRLYRHPGGTDANNIVSKGIPAVSLGMGDCAAHSPEEWVDVPQFLKACEIAVDLATGE